MQEEEREEKKNNLLLRGRNSKFLKGRAAVLCKHGRGAGLRCFLLATQHDN